MAQVILDRVVKRYGEVIAVNEVSLTVEDGEFVALVGPSGCGKTTTLNLIAGLLELTDGDIYIGEKLINDLDPKDRDIAMVFQNYALYPNKTVYKNLAFPLQMRKVPKAGAGRARARNSEAPQYRAAPRTTPRRSSRAASNNVSRSVGRSSAIRASF